MATNIGFFLSVRDHGWHHFYRGRFLSGPSPAACGIRCTATTTAHSAHLSAKGICDDCVGLIRRDSP